jgi:DNA-binding transcriptional LysR family regulator
MDTIKLENFLTVAKTESIRKASEILRITPSALSKSIRALEVQIGSSLIMPLGRGITLTQAGKSLVPEAEKILQSMQSLKEKVAGAKQAPEVSSLRIATFEVFSTYFMSTLKLTSLQSHSLTLFDTIPGELEQLILNHQADFGITYLPIPHPGLEHIPVTRLLMGVYKRRNTFKGLPQEDLPFVIPVSPITSIPTRVKGLDGWPIEAYERKIKYRVTLMETALELCRQGQCVGYFPAFIAEQHNQKHKSEYELERHPYTKSIRRCYTQVYLVKKKDRPEDAELKALLKWIRIGTKLSKEQEQGTP